MGIELPPLRWLVRRRVSWNFPDDFTEYPIREIHDDEPVLQMLYNGEYVEVPVIIEKTNARPG